MKIFIISTDRDRLDIQMIHQFLSERSYWAKGRVWNGLFEQYGFTGLSKPQNMMELLRT